MVQFISIEQYLEEKSAIPIIDVRSPGEFEKGHIPGAINVPLFSDAERATVGTAYKQKSKESAIEIGYEFVKPKINYFLQEAKSIANSKGLVIHCWRGGMRSQSFASQLMEHGHQNIYVIEKGYKAFRHKVLDTFELSCKLNIIGGFTGSGKTEILKELQTRGEQVIDLEGLANHKGSAFGGIGCGPQPTVEHFENNLFYAFQQLDFNRPIWIEDESRTIGTVVLPGGLFKHMRDQHVYFLDIPRRERAKFLVETYGGFDSEQLAASLMRISRKLGGLNTQLALEALQKGDYLTATEIALTYYDKYYLMGVERRDPSNVTKIPLETVDPKRNIQQIQSILEKH